LCSLQIVVRRLGDKGWRWVGACVIDRNIPCVIDRNISCAILRDSSLLVDWQSYVTGRVSCTKTSFLYQSSNYMALVFERDRNSAQKHPCAHFNAHIDRYVWHISSESRNCPYAYLFKATNPTYSRDERTCIYRCIDIYIRVYVCDE